MDTTAQVVDPPGVFSSIPEPDVDVLILPKAIESGEGLYDESVLTIVKQLRAEGVTAAYQHDSSSRHWLGERAAETTVLLDLAVAIFANAGYDALRSLLKGRLRSSRVRLRMGRRTDQPGDARWEWLEAEGPGEEVAKAIEAAQSHAIDHTDDAST